MSVFFRNLVRFGRLLREAGLDVPAGRMIDVSRALDHIDIGLRSDVYHALRALLVHRPQDLTTFDAAFRAFWRERSSASPGRDLRAMGRQRSLGPSQVVASGGPPQIVPSDSTDARDALTVRIAELGYSPNEALRRKDFGELADDELRQAQQLLARLTWSPGTCRTRRRLPDEGRELDLRRLVRRNVRYGAEPLRIPRRGRRFRPRPLVVVGDVSGSMERYSRMLLHLLIGLSGGLRHVEAFLFATRLTRVTRELTRRGADAAVSIPARVPDWGGGTRIGEAVRAFNVGWARRVRAHGPVVLLISDGWDRGEPAVLAREMARLRRSCRRLIWLNPLMGAADYQPLTRGMQAALPHVDDFLPAHNVDSLAALAAHLNRLD